MPPELILASRSEARATLLRRTGLAFEVLPISVDEPAVKAAMLGEDAPARDIADALAELKAQRGAVKHPAALVLGADQVLVCNNRLFDKPADRDDARAQLQELRGRAHQLLSAAVVYEEGRPVWRHVGAVRMTMRDFTDDFLELYLMEEGAALLDIVGAYRLEGRGAQLFSRVQGDYFSVLGLPLLELLDFLRSRGVCPR